MKKIEEKRDRGRILMRFGGRSEAKHELLVALCCCTEADTGADDGTK